MGNLASSNGFAESQAGDSRDWHRECAEDMSTPRQEPVMSSAFEALFAVDGLVRHPGRLAILTILEACGISEFLFLQSAIGIPNGNLSSHLTRLEAAGLVEIIKRFRGKWPLTEV